MIQVDADCVPVR